MAKSRPREVSILMPYKNEALHLEECIKSIIHQSFRDWELIAINDHSSDEGPSILSYFSSRDERIMSINNDGKGVIEALRSGMKQSSGKFISRMDADDIMDPDKIKVLRETLMNSGSGYVATGCVKYFSDTELGDGYLKYEAWLNSLTRSDSNFDDIYLECTIPSPCWMMYKSDLMKCGAFGSDLYPEDYDLAFRMKKANLQVIGINDVLHLWRDHPERSSRVSPLYEDNKYNHLKVMYFLELEFKEQFPLIIWGAGKKGKIIAKEFIRLDVPFRWITNNSNKTGLKIYDQLIEPPSILSSCGPAQVIIGFSTFHDPDTFEGIKKAYPEHKIFRFY